MDLVRESTQRLRAQGGRMTSQRRLIVKTLADLDSHPTADELYEIVKERDPNLHLSTVYRTLRWLEEEGLVISHTFDDTRQERFDTVHSHEHYHFVCRSCKTVIEFNNLLVNAIKANFELHTGAQVESGTVVLYGLCAKCRQGFESE
jgi:Fe2+ or Zn2+ uptake regulation protein